MAEKDKAVSAQSVSAFVQDSQDKIHAIQTKLQRLLDGYLEQDIEREIYREQKTKLLLQKKSLEEEIYNLSHKQNDWLEPFQNWIKVALSLVKIARDNNLLALRQLSYGPVRYKLARKIGFAKSWLCPHQDLNLDIRFRKPALCPVEL